MEYRMKDIMEPPKTLEEQKKEAREAAMAAGAEVLGEEWKPGTLENVKIKRHSRQVVGLPGGMGH